MDPKNIFDILDIKQLLGIEGYEYTGYEYYDGKTPLGYVDPDQYFAHTLIVRSHPKDDEKFLYVCVENNKFEARDSDEVLRIKDFSADWCEILKRRHLKKYIELRYPIEDSEMER